MEAFRLEIQWQLDGHLDLLEETQRKRELLALVDFDLRQRERQRLLPLLSLDRKRDGPIRNRVAGRRLHERDEHEVAPLLVFRADAKLLDPQRAGTVLANDEAAVELQLLFLARSLGLQFAHHPLRVRLCLAIDLLPDLRDCNPVSQLRNLVVERLVAPAELEALEHRADDEIAGARPPQLEGAVAQRDYRDDGDAETPAPQAVFLAQGLVPSLESPRGGERGHMPWIKAWHVIFMVTWFAGLFYLPRLFVYHASATDRVSIDRFRVMEKRLFAIMTIGAVLTAAFGLWLLVRSPALLDTGWMRAKLTLVLVLIAYHSWTWRLLRDFVAGRNAHGERWYRIFNEIPSLLLIGIVLLAVARPF